MYYNCMYCIQGPTKAVFYHSAKQSKQMKFCFPNQSAPNLKNIEFDVEKNLIIILSINFDLIYRFVYLN